MNNVRTSGRLASISALAMLLLLGFTAQPALAADHEYFNGNAEHATSYYSKAGVSTGGGWAYGADAGFDKMYVGTLKAPAGSSDTGCAATRNCSVYAIAYGSDAKVTLSHSVVKGRAFCGWWDTMGVNTGARGFHCAYN